MKSINSKITAILIVSFLLQIVLMGSLYRFVIAKRIIGDINKHEETRQTALQGIIIKAGKLMDDSEKLDRVLNRYSQEYKVNFTVEDLDGNQVYSNYTSKEAVNKIEETGFIRTKDKSLYIIHAYFPVNLKGFTKEAGGSKIQISLILLVLSIALITSFLIYEILAIPLKKLRKAMNEISYGNTITEIPYYGKDELGLLCRNFEDMGRRLKRSEDSQVELLQAISHDLKTPMTSILGFMKRLLDDKVLSEEKKKEYYEIIYRRSKDMELLIQELDEYGNINAKAKYESHEVDCGSFFMDMCEEMKRDIVQRGGSFECVNSINKPHEISVDGSQLKRVFSNIIDNSFKYGGDKCSITISASILDDSVLFEVCDDGEGASEEHLDNIFNRFYRVDSSRSREKGGTGLGLAICKGIIDAHGGRIYARQNTPSGLCICFTIPIKKQ